MEIKKIQNAPFHNANKLNGKACRAKYGIFKNGVQVGVVLGDMTWDAWDVECKNRIVDFSCGSLSQLKAVLGNK